MKRKLFFILTTVVLLIATACSGSFIDPGMIDQSGGGGGFSGGGDHDGGAPIPIVPPPSYATAEATKAHTIDLRWPSVPSAEKYSVSYSKNQSGPPWEKTIDTDSEYYTVKELFPGTLYYFLISANKSNKETIRTFSALATTLPLKEAEKNPIPLDRNKWTDGEITSENPDKEIWYSFRTPYNYNSDGYFIWWNDSVNGDGSKTLDVMVDAYYDYDGSNNISFERSQDNGWTYNMRFTSYATAKSMKLRVYPKNSGDTGTFAIVYRNSNTIPKLPCTVYFDSNGGTGTPPASITVNPGGTSTKLPDGGELSKSGYTFAGWSAAASDTVTYYKADDFYTVDNDITMKAVWISDLTGEGTEASPFQLTANTWADGIITSTTNSKKVWYSFDVTAGTTYYIWWNDKNSGDNIKTLDIGVKASFDDCVSAGSAWDTPKLITATSNDKVILEVYTYTDSDTGTFAIVFSESSTRP